MKQWMINLLFFFLAIASGVQLFVLKYQVVEKEEELKSIHRQILSDSREIHMLKADWALLNDPERLRALISGQTNFQSIKADRIIQVKDLPMRVPPVPTLRPENVSSNAENTRSDQKKDLVAEDENKQ